MISSGNGVTGRVNPQRGGIVFRFLFLIFFLALLVVVYLVRVPILRLVGGLLIVDDSPRASDVIVVMGDDDYDADSAARAAELIKAGWAPRVLATGRYLRPNANLADLKQHDLIAAGVPASAVMKFAFRARDTRDEAEQLGTFLSSRGWKKILVVTANYQTRRVRHILERTLAAGSDFYVVAARDAGYNPDDWWRHRTSTKNFFQETLAYLATLWELRHIDVRTS